MLNVTRFYRIHHTDIIVSKLYIGTYEYIKFIELTTPLRVLLLLLFFNKIKINVNLIRSV